MGENMKLLPPQVRSIIARQTRVRSSEGVVSTAYIMERVRFVCSDSIPDRLLEDAIAEEAVSVGLAVHFDHVAQASPEVR